MEHALSNWTKCGWLSVINEMAETDYVTHQCLERWNRKNWLPGAIKQGSIYER
jgi:hypothetical protein